MATKGKAAEAKALTTSNEIAEQLAEEFGLRKTDAREFMRRAIEETVAAVQHGGRVRFQGLGTFGVRSRSERAGRNPRTGEAITIPASTTLGFRPSSTLEVGQAGGKGGSKSGGKGGASKGGSKKK